MSDWLHNLPVPWMAVVVFGFNYLLAVAIFAIIAKLASEERAKSFKSISPGMLPDFGEPRAAVADHAGRGSEQMTSRAAGPCRAPFTIC